MLSELVRFRIGGAAGGEGRLIDVVADAASGDYPAITRFVYRAGGRRYQLPWTAVLKLDERRRRLTVPDLTNARAAPAASLESVVLLKRDVMDALLLDLAGRFTVRANDLWLEPGDGQLWLRAADVSPWAVLRRLGRGWLGHGGPNHLLDWRDVEFLRGDPTAAARGHDYHRRVAQLRPHEIAPLLDDLPYLHAAELVTLLPPALAAPTIALLEPPRQTQIFEEISASLGDQLLPLMAPDAAADLLGRLEAGQAAAYLERLPSGARAPIVELLRYPEDSAGGIMTNSLLAVPCGGTVGDALALLRASEPPIRFIADVFVVSVDPPRVAGVVGLRDLLVQRDSELVERLMGAPPAAVGPLTPAGEAADRVLSQHLTSLPVVADDGRLLGAITADAALRVLVPRTARGAPYEVV